MYLWMTDWLASRIALVTLPPPPPVRPSGHKRPLDDDDDDPVYLPEKSAKRRRLDRTAEIPSPPEEMLGIPSS
ncbi:hypothetical protein E4U22_003913, partial [Claviceps purpurea]